MILTEKEALGYWCPQSQACVTVAGDVIYNTLGGNMPTCAASACMAWRWFDPVTDDGTMAQPKPSPHQPRNPLPLESPLDQRRGFCGLAGKPSP